ncbi:MAG: tol-pal system protein YbgF [Pseudomonadota bacterium]
MRFSLVAFSMLVMIAVPMRAQAQVVDPRVMQLEEQIRQLTGRIEELNFQMLQLQETIRRQQEDNEFRLQQLEDDSQQGSVEPVKNPGSPQTDVAEVAPSAASTPSPALTPPLAETTVPLVDGKQDRVAAQLPQGTAGTAPPPRVLGTLTLDQGGEIVDFSANTIARSIDDQQVASISGEMNAEELYETGYGYVLNGDYSLAAGVFESFMQLYPTDPLAPDAQFWLGESLLGQGRFEEAAEAFIAARTNYPGARKAPETYLKIGTIMAALGNRDVACVTFADAVSTLPDMPVAVRGRIDEEAAKSQC